MAITITQQPYEYTPVYNGLHFMLTSTNSAAENFTIQMRVYEGATLLATVNYPYLPTNNIHADAGRLFESQLSPDFTPITSGAGWQQSDSWAKYTIEFQERFGSTPEVTGSTSTVTQYAWNGALRYFDYNAYDMTQYLVDISATEQNYLTLMPSSVKVRTDQSVELGCFTDTDGGFNPVFRAAIKTYDSNGNIQQTAYVNNPFTDYAGTDADRFLSFICGPQDLNSLTLDSGTQPLLTDGIYRYTVQFEDDDGPNATTILQEFIIDRSCSRYSEQVVLYFLNPLGRFDSFAFSLANQRSYNWTKSSFRKYAGQITGNAFAYNPYGEQRVVFDTQEQETWKLVSEYVTEDMALWMRDLLGSPKVYMVHPDYPSIYTEVTIDTGSYQVSQTAIERIFNLEMQVSLSAVNFRQRL